ncbi:biotin/lipoyl-binding protein [Alphaproteobacteria bacterium]|nr:biotin/lipoyl-binding protein [Alphaproteobacteria bacterium]
MIYNFPKLSANEDEVKVVKLNFKDGEFVKKGEIIAEIESTKATLEIIAEKSEKIFYYVEENSIHLVGDKLAEQADKKNESEIKNNEEIVITESAKSLMIEKGYTYKDFINKDIIRLKDVEELINKKPQSANSENPEVKFPLLNKYNYIPTANIEFSYSLESTNDPEADFWNKLFNSDIINICNTEIAHNFIYDGKTLHLAPITRQKNLSNYRNILDESALEVFRGKINTEKPLVCISYLKSDINFSHTPLLFDGSIITIAVAERINKKTVKVNITYDHKYLDGYSLLKKIETFN